MTISANFQPLLERTKSVIAVCILWQGGTQLENYLGSCSDALVSAEILARRHSLYIIG